jgi:hypothetical protein
MSRYTYYKDKKGQKTKPESARQKFVPTWFLFFFPSLLIFLGFASEHYKITRSIGRQSTKFRSVAVAQVHSQRTGNSLLTPEEDDALKLHDGKRLHLVSQIFWIKTFEKSFNRNPNHQILLPLKVFSTDCSPYQHWQR